MYSNLLLQVIVAKGDPTPSPALTGLHIALGKCGGFFSDQCSSPCTVQVGEVVPESYFFPPISLFNSLLTNSATYCLTSVTVFVNFFTVTFIYRHPNSQNNKSSTGYRFSAILILLSTSEDSARIGTRHQRPKMACLHC